MTRRRRPHKAFSPLDGISTTSLRDADTKPRTVSRSTTLRTRITYQDKRQVEGLCLRLSDCLCETVRPSVLLRAVLRVLTDAELAVLTRARSMQGVARGTGGAHSDTDRLEEVLANVIRTGVAGDITRR